MSAERRPGHAPATYSFRTKMPAGSPAQSAPIAVPTSRRGTLDEATVERGLGYATECGDGNRGDHTPLLFVSLHGSCQGEARAANAEVRDESKDNGCPTELRQARNFDCDVSLIETEHDEIGVKGCQDRSSDKCHVVHKPRDGIAQRVAHHAAGGAKDNKLDGHDDDHGEQRLQEQFGNVGNNLLKAAVDKVHEYNAQYDGHYRTRIVVSSGWEYQESRDPRHR